MDRRFLESILILIVGLFLHNSNINLISLITSDAPILECNYASIIFTTSMLILLSNYRPLWSVSTLSNHSERIVFFLLEMVVILYIVDVVLFQMWVPMLKLLDAACYYLGEYFIAMHEFYIINGAQKFSDWLRNDLFFVIRFLLSIVTFLFVLDVVGLLSKMIIFSKFAYRFARIRFAQYMRSIGQQELNHSTKLTFSIKNKRLISKQTKRNRRRQAEQTNSAATSETDAAANVDSMNAMEMPLDLSKIVLLNDATSNEEHNC